MPPAKKRNESAPESGLGAKIDAYFHDARRAKDRGRPGFYGRPRNPSQLSEWFKDRGVVVSRQSIQSWIDRGWSPGQEYIPHIEELLEAPWWWIALEETHWPPDPDDRLLFRLVVMRSSARERKAAAAILRERLRTP